MGCICPSLSFPSFFPQGGRNTHPRGDLIEGVSARMAFGLGDRIESSHLPASFPRGDHPRIRCPGGPLPLRQQRLLLSRRRQSAADPLPGQAAAGGGSSCVETIPLPWKVGALQRQRRRSSSANRKHPADRQSLSTQGNGWRAGGTPRLGSKGKGGVPRSSKTAVVNAKCFCAILVFKADMPLYTGE